MAFNNHIFSHLHGGAYFTEHALLSSEELTIRKTHLWPGSSSAKWINCSIRQTTTLTGWALWLINTHSTRLLRTSWLNIVIPPHFVDASFAKNPLLLSIHSWILLAPWSRPIFRWWTLRMPHPRKARKILANWLWGAVLDIIAMCQIKC